jgi:uncharacterized repeat protein (TIGR01451 family)
MSSRNRSFRWDLLLPILIGMFGLAGCQELQKGIADMQGPAATSARARNRDNVELMVTATPGTVAPGQKVMYEVTVRNGSKTGLTGFNISATIPPYTTVSLSDATSNAFCSGRKNVCQPGEEIIWGIYISANLIPGNAISLHFSALVNDRPPVPIGARLRSVVTATKIGLRVRVEPVVR